MSTDETVVASSHRRTLARFGMFQGRVVAKWNDDGRTMTLQERFTYLAPDSGRWEAPAGAIVDGASIPRFAWTFIGGPFEGKYRNASVIHDVACIERRRPWQTVHYAFYTGMRACRVTLATAKIMYAAVYHFGPRWFLALNIGSNFQSVVTSTSSSFAAIPLQDAFNIRVGAVDEVLQCLSCDDEVRECTHEPSSAQWRAFNRLYKRIRTGDLSLEKIREASIPDR